LRYKRAMRQLSKPGFWVTFVIITMLSALAFTAFQPGKHDLTAAVLIGIQMNFRAIIIIVGFSSLGTELYNPKVRSLFGRTRLRQLPVALELAASSLPTMIADMPDLKTAIKRPVSILNRMITRVERRLNDERGEQPGIKKVFIVTGTIGQGKTAWLARLARLLKEKGVNVGGILALRLVEEERTTGYDVSNISTGTRTPFLRHTGDETMGVERFTVLDAGYDAGKSALHPEANHDKEVIIIDEVGPLELRGLGWSERLSWLLKDSSAILIIAVRKNLTDEVTDKFGITGARVINVANADVISFANEIASLAKRAKA